MRALLALAALLIGTVMADAQGFPNHAVRIVVPFTAGGANDGVARAMADRLSKKWKQPVVVENRPGGATTIGTRAVIDAAPDGHTLLFTSSTSFVVTPHTTKLTFDPLKDLEPVLLAVSVAPAMAVGNHVPVKSVSELIAFARAKSRQVDVRLGRHRDLFPRRRRAFQAVGRHRHASCAVQRDIPGYYGHVGRPHRRLHGGARRVPNLEKAGKLKLIAMATPVRHPDRPDLPTIGETLKGYAIDVWFGFSAPKKTPAAVLNQLHADIAEVLHDPSFVKTFVRPQGFTAPRLTRAGFAEQVQSDYALWGQMVEEDGLTKKP